MTERKSPEAINNLLTMCEREGVQFVDIKFTDLPGTWQHFTVPISELTEDVFDEGLGFDGSSIRGFQTITDSDMVVVPDPETGFIDPFNEVPTLSIIGEPMDPGNGMVEEYDNNPRYVARKAVKFMRDQGIADDVFIGPELEFFIFDDARFGSDGHYAIYELDAREGHWNGLTMYEDGNMGHRPRHQEGYFPVPPTDSAQDLRSEMVQELQKAGMTVECHHHEVGGPGQAEIDIRYEPLLKQADNVMTYKYILKNVAHRNGKTITFMPKPIFGQSGSGMHTHQSLWKDGQPLFSDPNGYAGVSEMCKWYIGGLLKHAPSFLALAAPTTNSYKRLTPGYEAPVVLEYSKRNRSAAIRIPMYSQKPKAKRIEFRSSDPMANPYLAFSAMLMAGLDGIKNKIDPGAPHEMDLFDLEGEEAKKLRFVPSSLEQALTAIEQDHDYLLEGGVFTKPFIENYVKYKRENEVDPVRLRPHPYEFDLYYNA